jgi:hypothetical protein
VKLIYLPAFGMCSPNSYLLSNQWASSEMSSMDLRLRGTEAFHPYALASYWYWRRQQFEWEPEHFIFGDSGGFSAMTLGAQIDPRESFSWQIRYCTVGAVLDTPPVRQWSAFRECLARTVAATAAGLPLYLAARERGTPFRWWGVVHGRTTDELDEWYRAISKVYPFTDENEGWAFKPMTEGSRTNDPEAMRRVLTFIETRRIRKAHFFATSGRNAVETLAFYGPGAGLEWASVDSTSTIQAGARRRLLVATPGGWAMLQGKAAVRRMVEQCSCRSCDLLRQDVREQPDLINTSNYLRDRMMFHNTLLMVSEFAALAAGPSTAKQSSTQPLRLAAPNVQEPPTAVAVREAPTPPCANVVRKSLRVLSCVP